MNSGIGDRSTRLAMAVLFVGASTIVGQEVPAGTLTHATMEVDLSRPGATAHVRIDYRLEVPAGVAQIPITALVAVPTDVSQVQAHTPTRTLPVALPRSNTAQRVGVVRLPGDRPAGPLSLTIEYEVSRAITFDGTGVLYQVPLVVVDWPPSDARPGTFTARATVQPSTWVHESFPTTLAGPVGPPGTSVWEVELSVLPVYLKFRGRTAFEAPLLTLPRVVDTSVLALLLLLGFIGWQHMKDAL